MRNVLTIDVEDYFQVTAFEGIVKREEWNTYPMRVRDNTRRILDMLDENGIIATFFILGWLGKRNPSLVREIHERGHEVACHGYGHQRVYTQTRQEFRQDIRKSKVLLEDLIGKPVLGYRAPSYSISMNSLWAFDELVEAGYLYDSSVFPVRHDFYGIPDWPRFPFYVSKSEDGNWAPEKDLLDCTGSGSGQGVRMIEIPITTLKIAGRNIPIAGGGYFRFFPYAFTKWGLRRGNRTEKRPFIFYLHPWELDPDQPRIKGAGLKTRFRHYLNLRKTEHRFRMLLSDFKFSPMCNLVEEQSALPVGGSSPVESGRVTYTR